MTTDSNRMAYYVSGHGFGHARRSALVLRALRALRPELKLVVRTAAPAGIFAGVPRLMVSAPTLPFDPGAVERDPLTIDAEASMRRLAEVLGRRAEMVRAEAEFLRNCRARLVVADIPFLAADAAEAVGVPAVAVGNFTWDWIYEPFATADTFPLIEEIRASHAKFDVLLHLPLGHEVVGFREVIEVPLLAGRSGADRRQTLRAIGIGAADRRPRVLVGMRGGVSPEALAAVAAESPDVLFISNQPSPPTGVHGVGAGVDFTDLLAACDAVVSKVGYGILTDCIANGVALLFPPRVGFREDEISRVVCPRYLRMRELPVADFEAGRWRGDLMALLGQAAPPERIGMDGAEAVAREVVRRGGLEL